ncbi:MAG: alkaline phosphatase family protein [Candidatus Omnitrophica bacterium]|nr:alkaline phosphatase family protein [Candidatus Omnitrophota bacterium]
MPTQLLLLVDALSFEYLKWMPSLQRLAEDGKAYSVKPAAGFRGVEPALNGEWTLPGEVPFRFKRAPDSPSRFPPMLGLGDALLPSGLNRIYRLLLSKGFPGSYPHLIPSILLHEFQVSSGTSRVPTVIERWEQSGKKIWWYTRDSTWEKKKSLTARVYRKVYRPLMLEEALDALGAGSDVVYLEFSTILDDVGHHYGPNSPEMENACREFDRDLSDWITKARTQAGGDLSIGVISDHGMSEVTGSVDIEDSLQQKNLINGRDYVGIWNSNFAQIWPAKAPINKVEDSIIDLPKVRLLTDEERKEWFGEDLAYGEIILATEEGTVIRPNHFQGTKKVRGMHGHLHATSLESRALAVFLGPEFGMAENQELEMPDLFRVLNPN